MPDDVSRVELVCRLATSLDLLARLEAAKRHAYKRRDLTRVVSLDRHILLQRQAVRLRRRKLGQRAEGLEDEIHARGIRWPAKTPGAGR